MFMAILIETNNIQHRTKTFEDGKKSLTTELTFLRKYTVACHLSPKDSMEMQDPVQQHDGIIKRKIGGEMIEIRNKSRDLSDTGNRC